MELERMRSNGGVPPNYSQEDLAANSRPASYRHKKLTQAEILRALSQGQDRIPMSYNDYKQKWEKLQSKEGSGIRGYLEPYQKKLEEPERIKCHRDFLLDEVEYMNIDFREERKLKLGL